MGELDAIYQQIGRQYVLNYAAIGSGLGRLKPKKCKKGWECGYSCQGKDKKNCNSAVNGQAKTYAEWLSRQVPRTSATLSKIVALNKAFEEGDYKSFSKLVKEINDRTKSINLAPGERDASLKTLFEFSGYDAKPKVGTATDVTQAWKNGGTLMIRGVLPGLNSRDDHLKQFQSKDFFVGKGIYGDGTYAGHAGVIKNEEFVGYNRETAKEDAKRAWDDLAKYEFMSPASVVMRMALSNDARIGLQSKIEEERNDLIKKLELMQRFEERKIKSLVKTNASSSDVERFNNALTKAQSNNAKFLQADPKEVNWRLADDGEPSDFYSISAYSLTVKGRKGRITFEVADTIDMEKALPFKYKNEDGDWVGAASRKDALSKAKDVAIDRKNREDALEASGLSKDPIRAELSDADKKKLADIRETFANAIQHLGLDADDVMGVSRFAVLRGYDAIALDQSYEPKTFINLLNRSKVIIQKNELVYSQGEKTGAL